MSRTILILPGDGVGPEVTAQARRVLEWFAESRGLDLALAEAPYGAAAYAAHGAVLAEETLADCLQVDAVLFGATGGPELDAVPAEARRAGSLLRIRREMQTFANLRPIIGYPELADAVPLKRAVIENCDVLLIRELNGGAYFGQPRGIETLEDGRERAVNTNVYDTDEIERIARAAFDLARTRRGRLTSVDKSNVMETGQLWRRVVSRIGTEEYPDIALDHILVDNCAMQLARDPGQFDTMLADNMFGDILSDIGGAISGSLGMLPSASLSAPGADGRRRALYEPVHGSAPDIAGRGIANPVGAILSVALALRHSLDAPDAADLLEGAVRRTLGDGVRTADIRSPNGRAVDTAGMGEAILERLARMAD